MNNLKVESNGSAFDLKSYDLIAIDMDNTLVKYNLKNFLPLIHSLIQKFLIEEYDYPIDIREEFSSKLSQKGLVVDKSRGNILKLDSNYGIISAKHGFEELSEEQIQSVYGSIGEELKQLPELLSSYSIASPEVGYYVLKDYFTSPSAQVLAKTVAVMDKLKTSSEVSYSKIWNNIYEVLCLMFDKNAFKTRSGAYFPAMIGSPEKYLLKSSDSLKEWLKGLRKSGKHVVLITSSNVDYAKFLMHFSFGDQWISCFDCVLTFARKPSFFTTDRKFYSIDANDNIEGCVEWDQLKCGQIYSEGNWNELKSFVAKQSGRADPKSVYIGDSFNDDCIVPNKYVDCETIVIVEELEEAVRPELDPSYWQSFLADNHKNSTLWYQLMQKHSKLIVSKVDDLIDY